MDAAPTLPGQVPDPLVGRTVGGHYLVEAPLGRGGMGSVYRARHTLLHEAFAVKVLAADLAGDEEARRRFLVEARGLARVVHPNVVQVRHCGEEGGLAYLVMDLCRGETLAALLAREGALSEARAASIAVQVLAALEAAHETGVVHRDVKPSNVMIEPARAGGSSEPEVRVVDFGLARVGAPADGAASSMLVSSGVRVVGTVAYMSPEQLEGDAAVDGRSDLFSVGVVLYEMLSGRRPFEGESSFTVARKILDEEAPPLRAGGPLPVSPSLASVVARALAKDPDARFQSAGAFADAIRDALAGLAPPPAPARKGGPARRPTARPRRAIAWAAVALSLAAAAFAVSRMAGTNRDESDRAEGRQARLEGRFADADDAFTRLEGRGEASVDDRLDRARARIGLGKRSAEPDLLAATNARPEDPRVLLEWARFHARVRTVDYPKADTEMEEALRRDPALVDGYVERVRMNLARQTVANTGHDLDVLARRAPDDPRGPVLAAYVAVLASTHAAGPGGAGKRVAARAQAEEVGTRDPAWAEGWALRSYAVKNLAHLAREGGDPAAMVADLTEAASLADHAIALARAHRAYRGQGQSLLEYHLLRFESHFWLADRRAMGRDADEILRDCPRNDEAAEKAAYAMAQARRFDDAIRAYDDLAAASPSPERLGYLAFSRKEKALDRAAHGERAEAAALLRRAIEEYQRVFDLGVDRTSDPGDLAEAWFLLSQVEDDPTSRDADLAKARGAFDAIRDAKGRITNADALLRLSEFHAATDDLADATDEARRAIGGSHDHPPRYFLQLVRCLVAAATEKRGRGDAAGARADLEDALRSVDEALPRSPAWSHLWRGCVRLGLAALSAGSEAAALANGAAEDFAQAEDGAKQADVDAPDALRAQAVRGREEALRAASVK